MSLIVALSLLSVSLCEADLSAPGGARLGRFGLGLGVRAAEDSLVVSCVVPGSAAAAADLAIGHRIVAAGGEPVRTVRELEQALARAAPGSRLDLDLAREVPRLRLGVLAIGGLLAPAPDTQFGLLGAFGSYVAFDEHLRWLARVHYTALGQEPGTGRDLLSIAVGLEGWRPLLGPIDGVVAVLVGPDIPLRGSRSGGTWPVAPVSARGQLGLRWGAVDVFTELGQGPADGLTVSLGVALALGIGRGDDTSPGAGPLHLL